MAKVYFVGAGPGDPELITIKGRRLLAEADVVVYAGSLVNPMLLEGIGARIHDSSGMTLEEIIGLMSEAVRAGQAVVRLHTGDLSFFSAIAEQMERLRAMGVEYEAVPGVSSAGAGAAALCQELTIPEVSQTVIHTRMAGRTPVPEAESIESLAAHRATMVIFLSVSMIEELSRRLLAGGYAQDTPVVAVERASWPEQRIVRGTVADIAPKVIAAGIKNTALIYVGEAMRASSEALGRESKLYDRNFTHGFRK